MPKEDYLSTKETAFSRFSKAQSNNQPERLLRKRKFAMRKLTVAMMLALLIVAVMVVPVFAAGVSETGLGRCANPLHAPGTGAASHVWVPYAAWDNANADVSGLHFMTP